MHIVQKSTTYIQQFYFVPPSKYDNRYYKTEGLIQLEVLGDASHNGSRSRCWENDWTNNLISVI
jgi:hypothetical protein